MLIKFNLIVRAFNVIKTSFYFYINEDEEEELNFNIGFVYYLYNFTCFLIIKTLINLIELNLFKFNLICALPSLLLNLLIRGGRTKRTNCI